MFTYALNTWYLTASHTHLILQYIAYEKTLPINSNVTYW